VHYRPERKTVGELLAMTSPAVVVPEWQRNYSWTTSEVETFWKDMLQFSDRYPQDNLARQEYFLGSVVIVESNGLHLLLDGQQRLATSAILLAVIRDSLATYNRNAAVRLSHSYLKDYDDTSGSTKFKITLNRYDRDFFKREVLEFADEPTELPAPPTPTIESHRLIRNAKAFFTERLKEKLEPLPDATARHQWALRLLRVLTANVSVVAVFSDDEDNAAIVFETLNDRGIGLSTPDLLRNLLLRRAPEDQREEVITLWGQILQIEGDIKLKSFLRHYWISHHGDVKTQSLYREIKTKISDGNINSLAFSRQLSEASLTYRDIMAGNNPNSEVARLLNDINELEASFFYPAILSAFEVEEDANKLKEFLTAIICCYVRYSAIGKLESSYLEDFAFFLAKLVRSVGYLEGAANQVYEYAPEDSTFLEAFSKAAITRTATVRYILRELEHRRRQTEELEVSTPSRVHVEHIYPQTPLPTERWEQHNQFVNRLGNLTLLSKRINTTIKNASFAAKKPFFAQSEILLTSELGNFDSWSPEGVVSRQAAMAKDAVKVWPRITESKVRYHACS
jgi:uncharacterized protein with ParB-like and HNH nuclease domain